MRAALLLLLALFALSGCIKPEARTLKRAEKPILAEGWGRWERPGFSLAAPDAWSPYLSRNMLPARAPQEGESASSGPQWTIPDKDGDEARIAQDAKNGVPLRLYDNASLESPGQTPRYFSVFVKPSVAKIPEEIADFRASLGSNLASEGEAALPVGKAAVFEWRDSAASKSAYLLIDGGTQFIVEFSNTDPLLCQQIMETFRLRG